MWSVLGITEGGGFLPLQLPSDYKELCQGFVLAETEEYARDYEVPELAQPIFIPFYKDGAGIPMKGHLKALSNLFRERDKGSKRESQFAIPLMGFPLFWNTEEMADNVRETIRWHLRKASCPPCPLPEDYRDLCSRFNLARLSYNGGTLFLASIEPSVPIKAWDADRTPKTMFVA
ncbi:hypothetical protein Cgig2_026605 [Carnegiea gigantea]|uniref:Uncharacterized protein n=1 Tax=Carnegiea gigantea TaxID=171969 RepID=A0A9Q1KHE1_9CARY|nr:hypothetical protein Cgig2_026605 [Carnegiea gigantea]